VGIKREGTNQGMAFRGSAALSGTGYVMAWVSSEARQGLRCGFLGLAAGAAVLMITSDAAIARHHHRVHAHYARVHEGRGHHGRSEVYAPPASSILVDGNSGKVLEDANADALRHPASLTKVMTLYLLFERLDAGKIKLDTPLHVSEHASEQDPTKLDLKPGETIAVEDAIKGIVTKSANDAAVVVAENLGGDEPTFAKMMTQKARALGMSRTTYVNASGLPDDDQITTARDQALLGRAMEDRFPRYYKYFSTQSFVFHGEAMRNHNHLLGSVDGVDGIKTGFVRASGFNILTSMHRDGRYLIGVVMGGPSAGQRDAHMRELLADHFKEAALRRTAPLLADASEHQMESRNEAPPVAFTRAPMAVHTDPTASVSPASTGSTHAGTTHVAGAANDPIRPLLVRTITYRTAPVQASTLAPMPSLVPVQVPQNVPQSAPLPVATQPAPRPQQRAAASFDQRSTLVASADPTVDARVAAPQAAPPAAVPIAAVPVAPARAEIAPPPAPVSAVPATTPPVMAAPVMAAVPDEGVRDHGEPPATINPAFAAIPSTPVHARGGWLIQIGAYGDENEAKEHLTAAQSKVHEMLAAKDPFTERVLKGDKAFYRARFAGFDKATAEAACRQLKRSDFDCMALKD
jgi:D-alanyl-D-alanine carboxypeptidase